MRESVGAQETAIESSRETFLLAALRERDEQLRLVLDAAHMGTFVWSIREDRWEPDERAAAFFGAAAARSSFRDDVINSLIHPDDRHRCADALTRAIDAAGTGTLREEVRVPQPDGSVRWLTLTGQTTFDHNTAGRAPLAVRMSGIVADITDRKRREAQVALFDQIADDCARLSSAEEIMEVAGRHLGAFLHAPSVCLVAVDDRLD